MRQSLSSLLSSLSPHLPLPSSPFALPLRPSHPSDHLLYHLLRHLHPSHPPHVLFPSSSPPPPSHPSSHLHPLPSSSSTPPLSSYLLHAHSLSLPTFLLSSTPYDHLHRLHHFPPLHSTSPPSLPLPPDFLSFFHPLLQAPPDLLHDLSTHFNIPSPFPPTLLPHLPSLLPHSIHLSQALSSLQAHSDRLLSSATLSISHWGYIALALPPLLQAHLHQPIVLHHALSRLLTHVGSVAIHPHDVRISRLANDLFTNPTLPAGRTVAGVVLRPATGRFARRLHPNVPVVVISREPDAESGDLMGRRLGGNLRGVALNVDGRARYWDGRFVVKVESRNKWSGVGIHEIVEAAMRDEEEGGKVGDGELVVRQIRRKDWEEVAALVGGKGKWVPHQCVRGLPAVFERTAKGVGEFVGSAHLGVCTKSDLVVTAVRMPRVQVLPEKMEPGFRVADVGESGKVGGLAG